MLTFINNAQARALLSSLIAETPEIILADTGFLPFLRSAIVLLADYTEGKLHFNALSHDTTVLYKPGYTELDPLGKTLEIPGAMMALWAGYIGKTVLDTHFAFVEDTTDISPWLQRESIRRLQPVLRPRLS